MVVNLLSRARRWHEDERLRFLAVGGWNTVFGYLTFVVLYHWLSPSVHYLLIAVMAHIIAVTQSFLAQRLLVFRSRAAWVGEFARFNLVQLAFLAYGLAGLWLCVSVFHMGAIVSQACITLTAVVLTYFTHLHFTFRGRSRTVPLEVDRG